MLIPVVRKVPGNLLKGQHVINDINKQSENLYTVQ